MKSSTVSLAQLASNSKIFVGRLLTIGQNRLELLTVELQEERGHFLRSYLLALGVAAFGLLTGLTLTAAITVLLWERSHVAALFALSGIYAAAGIYLYRQLIGALRNWQTFPASLDQIRKDRVGMEKIFA